MPHLRYKGIKQSTQKALYGCQAFLAETSEYYSSHYEIQRAYPLPSVCTSRVNTPPAQIINSSGKHMDKYKQQVLKMMTPHSESECIRTATPAQTSHHTLLSSYQLKQDSVKSFCQKMLALTFFLSTHLFLQRKGAACCFAQTLEA